MKNISISYNPKNVIASGLIELLSKVDSVTLYEGGEMLTVQEIKRVKKSIQSGKADIEVLKKMLK